MCKDERTFRYCSLLTLVCKSDCRFDAAHRGKVFARRAASEEEVEFTLFPADIAINSTPPPGMIPPGLSLEKQWYLFDCIRQFVKEEEKDTVCPRPSAAKPSAAKPSATKPSAASTSAARGSGTAARRERSRSGSDRGWSGLWAWPGAWPRVT